MATPVEQSRCESGRGRRHAARWAVLAVAAVLVAPVAQAAEQKLTASDGATNDRSATGSPLAATPWAQPWLHPRHAAPEQASAAGRGGLASNSTPAPVVVEATEFAVSSAARNALRRPAGKRATPRTSMPRGAAVRESRGSTRRLFSTPPPGVSFDGLSNIDNAIVYGGTFVNPPDTVGDVGPNHYVQAVNLLYQVFSKAGLPLTSPTRMSSLFPSGACATGVTGDFVWPMVLYDPLADRWLLSQIAVGVDFSSGPHYQCIAISRTGDPTGAYFAYTFEHPGGNVFHDWAKFGVWPDGYYMATNQFAGGASFDGAGAFAFDRTKMLAGDPSAGFIYFDVGASEPSIAGLLPSDLDGTIAPPAGTPNYFAYFTASEFGDPGDALRIFEFHANFANPSSSTFTERADSPLPVAPFNPISPPGRNDIEQPPPATTSAYLDSISDRLMPRLAYRNFGSHESLVTNHTVNVGTGNTVATHRAGVRTYELRRSLPGGSFVVPEQSTFAPDTDNRWMGSAAMDGDGNLAVGYSVSSLTTFPSIRYASRLATDPPNGLFQGEQTLIAGSGVQRTGARWGDSSALSVDPTDDCTFWYTNEYYSAASQATSPIGWRTRIGTFRIPSCDADQPDTTKPTCLLRVVTGPPKRVVVTLQDTGSGIASIVVTKSINSSTVVPPFTVGTTGQVTVTSTKINQSQSSQVELRVTDVAGNVTVCDPVMTIVTRDEDKPYTQSFSGLPEAESKITLTNGTPGIKTLLVVVNGIKFKVKKLKDGESARLDVASAMKPGSNNTIELTAKGKKKGTLDVVIADVWIE